MVPVRVKWLVVIVGLVGGTVYLGRLLPDT